MGSSAGGSASNTSPSTRTVNVSGSTSMRGSASLSGRSALLRRRGVGHRDQAAVDRDPVGEAVVDRGRGDERDARRGGHRAVRAEHRPRQHRLRGRDRGVRVAHRAPGDRAALDHQVRPHAEEGRLPQHQVGQLAGLDRADLGVDALRDRRADRVLGDVAPGAQVVGRAVARQRTAACLHHVRGLPGAQHHLADPAHRLRVGADDGDRAEVVQQVLGGHRGRSDPALRERQVLRHGRVQVVADHQHVEVLGERVAGVRPGRVGRGRQHVGVARRP